MESEKGLTKKLSGIERKVYSSVLKDFENESMLCDVRTLWYVQKMVKAEMHRIEP